MFLNNSLAKIEIQNLQKKFPLNLRKIKKAIKKILKTESNPDIHLTISFVDDRKIRELNFRYRKVDSPTDILSFDYSQPRTFTKSNSYIPKVRGQSMGEIIISPQIINSNAKRFRTSRESEMYLCLIHGILHLLGYDDQSPKNRRLMKKREREILAEIESRPFVEMKLAKRIRQVSPSATLQITARAKEMRQEGLSVISFAAGEPDFDTPAHIKDAAIEAIRSGFTKYTATSGIQELKLAISKKFKDDNRLNYDLSQIVVSCGAKHSLYNCLQALCEKGDEVIVPSPYWVSYPEMIKLAQSTPIIIETDPKNNFKLTKKLLQSVITKKTKALILNTPSNPTGSVYNLEELKAVAEIAVSSKIWVISDEIYEKIIYDGAQHTSIASLGEDIYNLTITVNGVSKTYSMTGWRIGYLAGPRELAAAINNLQDHSTSNPTSIAQKAALAALTGNQDCVRVMVKEFCKRRDYMMERLKAIEGLNPIKPEGAFYIFCDISKFKIDTFAASKPRPEVRGKETLLSINPETNRGLQTGDSRRIDSVAFACKLLEEAKVAVIPGTGFGWDNYIRLSFATGMDEIKEGVDRLAKFLAETR